MATGQATGTAFGSGPVEESAHPAVPGRRRRQGTSRGEQSRVGAGRIGRGEGPGQGDVDEQAVHDRAELHHVPDRGRGAQGPDLHEPAGGTMQVVLSATGANNNRMQPGAGTCGAGGKESAVADRGRRVGRLGQRGVDDIVFSDRPRNAARHARGGAGLRHAQLGVARGAGG